jgi:hypothetical protein
MRLVVEPWRLNAERGTGGPFGAAVFGLGTSRPVTSGLSFVVPARTTRTRAFGFDEGTKLCEWAFAREECGNSVERDVLR